MGAMHLINATIEQFTLTNLVTVFLAMQLGIIIGMLPGLTATMGVALLTTLTFKWSPDNAIATLIAIYVGAIYGGSRTAILLNIPGTPANAATCFDGYPLALSGRGAEAIGLATTASFLGSVAGLFALSFFTPLLGDFALEFRSYEIFWLAIFGIVICGNLTAMEDHIKGWIAGMLGIILSFVGMDAIQGYRRFTFDMTQLDAGFDIIPVLVGVYGFVEILDNLSKNETRKTIKSLGKVIPKISDIIANTRNILRSGLIGVVIGIIPGVGENIAAYVAYDFEKRASKHPERFGKGAVEGLIASETASNASVGGCLVPVLALAIPGSPPAAVLLAALYLHNINPGPLLMIEKPLYIYEFSAMFLWATVAMFVLGLTIVKPLLKVLNVRNTVLMPCVFVGCTIGTFAINGRFFDLLAMLFFGLLGFAMRKLGYPETPLVLGIILGPMLDENLRRGLLLNNGDFTPFLTTPISMMLITAILLTLFGRPLKAGLVSLWKKGKTT